MLVRQWTEKHGIDDTENRRSGADSECQGGDCDGCESRALGQNAQAVPQILYECPHSCIVVQDGFREGCEWNQRIVCSYVRLRDEMTQGRTNQYRSKMVRENKRMKLARLAPLLGTAAFCQALH